MKEQLIDFETAKLAKDKRFNIRCADMFTDKPSVITNIAAWDEDKYPDYFKQDLIWRPTQGLLQRWLREIHNIHINIIYEEYIQRSEYKYFHYDISNDIFTDVTKNQDLFDDLLEECSQDIPGNHLNDEKFSKLIFERNFAFKTYEDALEHGLQRALKLVKV